MGNVYVGKCGDSWKIVVEDTILILSPETTLELLRELDEKVNLEATSRSFSDVIDSSELILE